MFAQAGFTLLGMLGRLLDELLGWMLVGWQGRVSLANLVGELLLVLGVCLLVGLHSHRLLG